MTKNQLLNHYGKAILKSKYFEKSKLQRHHLRSDVASHSINTARFCIRFYDALNLFHVDMDLQTLIIAALSHDLGMLDRKENFSTKHECYTKHPAASVQVLKDMGIEPDDKLCSIISSHMFPLTITSVPESREAWVLTLADKCAAVTDWFAHYDITDKD